MARKCKQSEHYVYASQKEVAGLKERIEALEELLTQSKGVKNDDDKSVKETDTAEQGSGEGKSVPKNSQGGKK